MQEHRTAGIAARHLRDHGYDVTEGIGKTHSPHFAPVIHPTLATGVESMVAACLAWLAR